VQSVKCPIGPSCRARYNISYRRARLKKEQALARMRQLQTEALEGRLLNAAEVRTAGAPLRPACATGRWGWRIGSPVAAICRARTTPTSRQRSNAGCPE